MPRAPKKTAKQLTPAREQLAAHLTVLHAKRATVAEFNERWRRLDEFKQTEADAKARLDQTKARQAQLIAGQLSTTNGAISEVDHGALVKAEREVARAKRDADAARACEQTLSAQSTAATQDRVSAEQYTPVAAAAVLAGEAADIVAEINAGIGALRSNLAKFWGLRTFLSEDARLRQLVTDLPSPAHPDSAHPEWAETTRLQEEWRSYARRLASDPGAQFGSEERAI